MCAQQSLISAQADQSFRCPLEETLHLRYLKFVQWRYWSDCANAHAELNLRWMYMSEGMFSDVETLIVLVLFKFQILGEYRAPYINILYPVDISALLFGRSISSKLFLFTFYRNTVFNPKIVRPRLGSIMSDPAVVTFGQLGINGLIEFR